MATVPPPAPEWKTAPAPVPYPDAIAFMEERVEHIRAGTAPEMVWLLEHPPVFTGGASADARDLIDSLGFPVIRTGRGGQFTYHGPGQRVAYVMLDLKRRMPDIRRYVQQLEGWLIATLADFGVHGFLREGRVGVWVETPTGEAKIAALGVRVRKWVSYHGIALNVAPDLSHYRGIIPCGISDYGVTSLETLGVAASMADIDTSLKRHFPAFFDVG